MSKKIINLHKELIEDELRTDIIDLEKKCEFGQQFIYLFWYEENGTVKYSVARVVGNEYVSLGMPYDNKKDTKEMVEEFCEIAKDEDNYDGSIPSVE
ncbi:hypothetical protein [Priestia megaterium]|uniref:hypothetical protein n=1 Tax=Priestia megaterium TaxID=1404 RepID=UPI00398FC987